MIDDSESWLNWWRWLSNPALAAHPSWRISSASDYLSVIDSRRRLKLDPVQPCLNRVDAIWRGVLNDPSVLDVVSRLLNVWASAQSVESWKPHDWIAACGSFDVSVARGVVKARALNSKLRGKLLSAGISGDQIVLLFLACKEPVLFNRAKYGFMQSSVESCMTSCDELSMDELSDCWAVLTRIIPLVMILRTTVNLEAETL